MHRISLLLIAGCCFLVLGVMAEDKRIPLIGILMQNGHKEIEDMIPDPVNQYTYVASSYVEWVSHTGATPVLIPYDMPTARLRKILDNLNGVLLPGGGTILKDENQKSSMYQIASEEILKYAEEKYDRQNIVFPIFAICLGFESVMMRYGGNAILTNGLNDSHIDHPIILNETAFISSKFFSKLDQSIMRGVLNKPAMYYSHNLGIRYDTLKLPEFLRIYDEVLLLGSSKTGIHHDGSEFVAMIEHKRYPIYGVQYHPEKIMFERQNHYWFMDRSTESLILSNDIIATFVDIARETSKQYPSIPDWFKPHIATYWTPINTGNSNFESMYVLPRYYAIVQPQPNPTPIQERDFKASPKQFTE
jgi:gamma-glutamyl hydrolase